jgi:hypothetical protein
MPFALNDKKDEIDETMVVDAPRRVLIEAHAVASKPVSDLFQRALRADKKAFTFDGVAKQSGYMQIQAPGDNKHIYQIGLELVPKDHNVNLERFKNAKNFEQITVYLSKFFKHAETLFDMLKKAVEVEYPDVLDWKLNIDESNSTMYIDPDHSKRVGIVIHQIPVTNQMRNKLQTPKKEESSASSSSNAAPAPESKPE